MVQAPEIPAQHETNSALKRQEARSADARGEHVGPLPIEGVQPKSKDEISEKDRDDSADEASEFWVIIGHRLKITDSLLVIFTLFLFFATFALWWSTHRLWKSGEKQIAIAKQSSDALVAAERAQLFILMDYSNVEQKIRDWIGSCSVGDDGSHLAGSFHVSYWIKNFGKTPAVIKEISHEISFMTDLMPEPYYIAIPSSALPSRYVIEAGGHTDPIACQSTANWPIGVVRGVANRECSIWFIGRVVYDDVMGGKNHETGFVWRYRSDGQGFRRDYSDAYNKRT